jgi:hypothetical protein
MGKASGAAAAAAKSSQSSNSQPSKIPGKEPGAGASDTSKLMDIDNSEDYSEAHAWKPIQRSFLRASPLENSGFFLLSELPMPILHMEFDWAVKKKNVRQAIWTCIAFILVIVEMELAWNAEKKVYEMKVECEVIKAVVSFITVMQLYYCYDYYEYLSAGAKKEWYKMLYSGRNPGPVPSFSQYLGRFLLEFFLISLHCPPYFDFRFWENAAGQKKVFISDKMNVFIFLRTVTFIRVLRDYCDLYARRRLVYDGGYRARGGQEIDSAVAIRAYYRDYPGMMTGFIGGVSILMLAYMAHAAERDWQPEQFTFFRCIWWVLYMTAAMDFDSMGVQSEFGKIMAVLVVVWGLILLSMFVSVVFELVNISSYEGWAYQWLNQMELLQQERDKASSVIAMWFKYQKARIEVDEKYGKDTRARAEVVGKETAYAVNMINKLKELRELRYLLQRAEGTDGGPAEAGVSLSDKLRVLKDTTIGKGADESSVSAIQANFELRDRARRLEESQAEILTKMTQLCGKFGLQAAPVPHPAPEVVEPEVAEDNPGTEGTGAEGTEDAAGGETEGANAEDAQ